MKKIPLGGKYSESKFALVDDEDYEELVKHNWTLSNRGYALRSAYNKGMSKTILMHRAVLNAKKGLIVDHINHDKLDNQKINLRLCTNSQNQQNSKSKKNSTSIYKGVSLERGKYRVCISFQKDGKTNRIHLGYFATEAEAAHAYNLKATELFGEFAFLNEIN